MKKDFSSWRGSLAAALAWMVLGTAAQAEPFVVGWGMNANGQAVPVPVQALSGATAIAAGYHHSLAVVDGCVQAWGWNNTNQCAVPPAGRTNIVAVAAGDEFSLALRNDGTAVAWGSQSVLGNGRFEGDITNNVRQIAAGERHLLVLKKDGSVMATGYSVSAQECVVPDAALSDVEQVAAGARFSLARKKDRTVVAWGTADEAGGVLDVPESLQGHAVHIAAGHYHALAVTDAGAVVAWGSFADNYPLPDGAKSGVTAVAAGYEFSLALKSDGRVLAWGDDEGGRLDLPASLVAGVSQIAAGYGHGLALGAGLAPYWLEDSVPGEAYVARPYSGYVSATGMPAVVYHKAGNWPAWLKLDSGTGVLSGTPAATSRVVEVSVVASNEYGMEAKTFGIQVSDTPLDPPGFITTGIPNGEIGLSYSFRILASNAPVFHASRTDSYPLPAGLTLEEDGTLRGTPVEAYDSIFYVTASNATAAVEQEFRMTVTGPSAAPEIMTGSPLPPAVAGTAYSVQFETDREATFAIVAGQCPAGLDIEPASGVLSGTPAASGPFTFTVQAANSFGASTAEFELAVNAAPSITTAALPGGNLGTAYSQTIAATGWPVPTFALASGSLPGGLVLGADGVISGTPTAAGTFTFGAVASNAAGSDTRNFSIAIDSTPPVEAPRFTAMTFIASNKTVKLEWTTPNTNNTYLYWSTNISSATPAWKSMGRKKSGAAIAQTNNTPVYYRLRVP
jgi:hypothetical protein